MCIYVTIAIQNTECKLVLTINNAAYAVINVKYGYSHKHAEYSLKFIELNSISKGVSKIT